MQGSEGESVIGCLLSEALLLHHVAAARKVPETGHCSMTFFLSLLQVLRTAARLFRYCTDFDPGIQVGL